VQGVELRSQAIRQDDAGQLRRGAPLFPASISVISEPGIGSCFTVVLPFLVARTEGAEEDAREEALPVWEGAALRILLVEDNEVNSKFATTLLGKLGYTVVLAQNGQDCLAVLKKQSFDLVLMDIQMPVVNGREALQAIRSTERGTVLHQPVIALTAYALRGDRERFLREGFDGYLSKPFRAGELVGEMKRVRAMFAEHPFGAGI
jgi:two-component system, cell cycle sensor histidine kinase and response regulator CckA